jgi:hypothetical protein
MSKIKKKKKRGKDNETTIVRKSVTTQTSSLKRHLYTKKSQSDVRNKEMYQFSKRKQASLVEEKSGKQETSQKMGISIRGSLQNEH